MANAISLVLDPTMNLAFFSDGKQSVDGIETAKVWADGHRTNDDKVEDGKKFYLIKALARVDGEAVENVTLTLRSLPNHDLQDFEPLRLKGKVKVSVRGTSSLNSTFVTLHYGVIADGLEESKA